MAQDACCRNDALVDPDLVRKSLAWGFSWLLLSPTAGVARGEYLLRAVGQCDECHTARGDGTSFGPLFRTMQ